MDEMCPVCDGDAIGCMYDLDELETSPDTLETVGAGAE